MEYKNNIKSVTNKDYLTFNELTDIIVRGYGEEKEDGTMVMGDKTMKLHFVQNERLLFHDHRG